MPLYEYECNTCGDRFERIQRFSDPLEKKCPACGGPVRKLLSSPAIQFKGTGWYVTDYAKKSGAASRSDDGAKPSSPSDSKTKKDKQKTSSSSDTPASSSSSSSTSPSASKGSSGSTHNK